MKGLYNAKLKTNEQNFKKVTCLGDDLYEIQSTPKSITIDLPIYLGIWILQFSKLHMIKFMYNCLNKYIHYSDRMLGQSDTDSLYAGYAGDSIDDVIRPEKKREYNSLIYDTCREIEDDAERFFVRKCCKQHTQHDNRSLGLLKIEASGVELLSVCSKTYILLMKDNQIKMSAKGVNQKSLLEDNAFDRFKATIKTKQSHYNANYGFKMISNQMVTYQTYKRSINYLYIKRKVSEDGVSTEPLDIIIKTFPLHEDVTFIQINAHVLDLEYIYKLNYLGKEYHSGKQMLLYLLNINQADFRDLYNKRAIGKSTEDIKLAVYKVCYLKYEQVAGIKEILMETGDNRIINCSVDFYMGIGMNTLSARWVETNEFPGLNTLGEVWMDIRTRKCNS